MPLQKLQFRPGLNREGTDYANEGGWYDGDKVRFRSGFPEKLGGWSRLSNDTYLGVARSMWNWIDLNGSNYLGIGTNIKYYIERGGQYNDITPFSDISTPVVDAFSATDGSSTIVVTDGTNSPGAGDYVVFSGAVSLGGNITAAILNQEYEVTSVISTTQYTIEAKSNITGAPVLANASDTGNGGSLTTISYQVPIGNEVYTLGTGWGAGPWAPTIVATLTNPLTTTSGSGVITVAHPSHGLVTGNSISILNASPVGGISSALLNVTFSITYVDANSYTIRTNGNTGTVLATSSATGGGTLFIFPQSGLRGWGTAFTSGIGSQLRLWSNDNFGSDLVIAPRDGGIYYWESQLGVATRATALSTLADTKGFDGDYVPHTTNQVLSSAIQRFVIAMGANSYLAGTPNTDFDPMLVRWSDQENPFEWVPDVTNQAGEFSLSNGSYIMTAEATRQEILIWTDSCLYSMQYLGAPYVWGFNILMDNISIMSPNASITVNNVTYWMGTDKFYMYSGRVETLPCALRQYIFEDINKDQSYQVVAGSNEGYNEVWWFYVSDSSQNTAVDKYVIYNYLDRVWYYGSLSRTGWLDSGIRQFPMAAVYTPAASFTGSIQGDVLTVTNISSGIVSLDAVITAPGITADTVVESFGTGTGGIGTYILNNSMVVGSQTITIVGKTGRILFHESSVDDNAGLTTRPIYSYVQSSDFDIGDGHNFGFVWRILPDINFNGSNVNNPEVTMTVRPRQNSGAPYGRADNPSVTSADNFTSRNTYNVQEYTGQVYTRIRGRQMSFRIESDKLGVAWQLGSPRIDIRNDGRR